MARNLSLKRPRVETNQEEKEAQKEYNVLIVQELSDEWRRVEELLGRVPSAQDMYLLKKLGLICFSSSDYMRLLRKKNFNQAVEYLKEANSKQEGQVFP